MAKKKAASAEKIENIFETLAEKTGGRLLRGLGACKYHVCTGNLALNYICSAKFIGGGLPGGKVTEFYGPPATAKSLIGYSSLGGVQRMAGGTGMGFLHDAERAANENFAISAGHVDENRIVVYETKTYPEFDLKVSNVTSLVRQHYGAEVPVLHVLDSMTALLTEREWSELELPEEYSQAEFKRIVGANEQPGERAKAASKLLRKIVPFLDDNLGTMLVINQTRKKIGVMYGDPNTPGAGGEALPFYASCRISTAASKAIVNEKTGRPLGVNLTFRNKKCRSQAPFMTTSGVQLYFTNGIDPLGGLLSVLIAAERVEMVSKGNYRVLEPWADTSSYTFKASATRNDVPAQVLLDCPTLVDAQSTEEVRDFLEIFDEAISLSNSSVVKEVAMTQEAEEELLEHLGMEVESDEE